MTMTSAPRVPTAPAQGPRAGGSGWGRHLLVTLHVLASLGWWATGLAQLALTLVAVGTVGEARLGPLEAAQHIDHGILIYFANGALYTGVMLSVLTPWGLFRHWWVTVKFVATIGATTVGIMLLGQWRQGMIDAAATGAPGPPAWLVVSGVGGTVALLAFLVWVSIAKPWGRIGSSRAGRPGAGRPGAGRRRAGRRGSLPFLLACLPPLLDYAVSIAAGFPSPLMQLLTLLGYPVWAALRSRGARAAAEVPG